MEECIIICARVNSIDKLAVPGSSTDKTCKDCGEAVIIAPSGQRLLKEREGVQVMCFECFSQNYKGSFEIALAAPPEEIAREIAAAELWRNRN